MAEHARSTVPRLPRLTAAVRAFGLVGVIAALIAIDAALVALLALREVHDPWLAWPVMGGFLSAAGLWAWRFADPDTKKAKKQT